MARESSPFISVLVAHGRKFTADYWEAPKKCRRMDRPRDVPTTQKKRRKAERNRRSQMLKCERRRYANR